MVSVLRADSLDLLEVNAGGAWQGRFDVVYTDPPYKISRKDMIKPDGYTLRRDFGEDEKPLSVFRLSAWLSMLLKPDANILVWCSDRQVGEWAKWLGEDFDRVVVGIWEKSNPAPNVRRAQWTQATELWVWAARGDYTFNWLGQRAMSNIDRSPHLAASRESTGHPNQKPEAICERHLRVLSNPGDLVLDPFAGSGTTGAVCKMLGRRCVCVERDAHWAKVANERIERCHFQAELWSAPERRTSKEQCELFAEVEK